MTDTIPSALKRLCAAGILGLCTLCALCGLAPAQAQALPPAIAPVWYGTTVDLAAGTATFSIRFDRVPDLLTVDPYLRQADTFQFWTDAVSTDPLRSTYDGILGLGPLGTQAVLTAVDVPETGRITYIWPKDAAYTGPRDSGGWGQVEGDGAYTLDGATVTFDAPLSILNAADGHFYYVFETYQYGSGGEVDYFGEAGKDYWVSPVPEPSGVGLLTGGMLVLRIATRRRASRRKGARPARRRC